MSRYRPWEQKDLLIRLQTFRPRSWFGKPTQISAVTCARYGWINSGPDNLKCEVSSCLSVTARAAGRQMKNRLYCAVLWRVFGPANQAKVVLPGNTEGELSQHFRRIHTLLCSACQACPFVAGLSGVRTSAGVGTYRLLSLARHSVRFKA